MSELRAKGVSTSANHKTRKLCFIKRLDMAHGPYMEVSGKILPGHIAHIDADIPSRGKGAPIAAPERLLRRVEDGIHAVVFALGEFSQQRCQFIDGGQAPGAAGSKAR